MVISLLLYCFKLALAAMFQLVYIYISHYEWKDKNKAAYCISMKHRLATIIVKLGEYSSWQDNYLNFMKKHNVYDI